jgi:probable rRNA maturation factor
MTPRSRAVLAVEIIVESPLWKTKRSARNIVQRAVSAAAAQCRTGGDITIVLTDDTAIRKLNRTWRGLDEPTNVLSFPTPPPPALATAQVRSLRAARSTGGLTGRGSEGEPQLFLGDIVIAYETTAREALAESKPFPDHLSHLAVHGFLHLLGYDHVGDEEAEAMEKLERAILVRLDLPDPYAQRETLS